MNMLEILTAREQLMEDIECIIESRIDDDCDGWLKHYVMQCVPTFLVAQTRPHSS